MADVPYLPNSLADAFKRERLQNLASPLKWLAWVALAFGIFSVILLAYGKDPVQAYSDIFNNTLASSYGMSEVITKMIPLVIMAVAVALPARLGLVNVGGEGQLYMGGLFASWGALTFTHLPAWLLLPFMGLLGFAGGALWAAIPAFLRAKGWLLEVFSTLVLNYVAILAIEVIVFGPWRDPSKTAPDSGGTYRHSVPRSAGSRYTAVRSAARRRRTTARRRASPVRTGPVAGPGAPRPPAGTRAGTVARRR